jgi:hypothetical protein
MRFAPPLMIITFPFKSNDYDSVIHKSKIPFQSHSGEACAGLDPVAGGQ